MCAALDSHRSVIKESFKAHDKDRSGTLSLKEVIDLVEKMNFGLLRADVENMFHVGTYKSVSEV